MRKIILAAASATLALSISGCEGLFGGGTSQQPPATPSPVAVSPSPTGQPSPEASPEASPQPSQPTASRGIVPPDLISSTDPNQRIQQIQDGRRSDPFSLIQTTPTVQFPQGAVAPTRQTPSAGARPGQAPNQAGAPSGSRNQPSRTAARPGTSRSGSTPGRLAPIPNLVPRRSPIATAPPRPQPDIARAVQVTGVVQIGDTVYAIVQAPNEPSSRYVQAGQRLSNGQVLVRRIDVTGAEPVVVFEQYGVEVITAVGEGGTPATTGATPSAALPSGNNGATS